MLAKSFPLSVKTIYFPKKLDASVDVKSPNCPIYCFFSNFQIPFGSLETLRFLNGLKLSGKAPSFVGKGKRNFSVR